jgi:perosamine synthetase
MSLPKFSIPVNEPVIFPESKANVIEALETGWISSAGGFITEFEKKFADFIGVRHGIAVCNGTAALHVALTALGIGRGDEVIVPAFTMAATWMSVLYTGATPIFVDCDEETFNIDVSLIEKKITSRTKAILPVHLYGHPVDIEQIISIAKKYKLKIVEDAAEAHGAEYNNQKCGSFGILNCFSFYANKIITTGEGGMIVTNDDQLAEESRRIRDMYHFPKRFIHERIGFNYRMTNLQAAIGSGQMEHVHELIDRKLSMADTYYKFLHKIPGLRLPITKKNVVNVHWMYAVLIDPKDFGADRDIVKSLLKEKGIDTRDFFYPPHSHPVLKDYLKEANKYPVTERISSRGLYLPSGSTITSNQIETICNEIKNIYKNLKEKNEKRQ